MSRGVRHLERGALVRALRVVDPQGANVPVGTVGVVFEECDYHEQNTGPMVRWLTGGCCNVYERDVERVS